MQDQLVEAFAELCGGDEAGFQLRVRKEEAWVIFLEKKTKGIWQCLKHAREKNFTAVFGGT